MLDLTGTDPDMLHKGTSGKGKKVCYYISHDLIHYVSHDLIHYESHDLIHYVPHDLINYVSHDVTIVFICRGTLEY